MLMETLNYAKEEQYAEAQRSLSARGFTLESAWGSADMQRFEQRWHRPVTHGTDSVLIRLALTR